MYSTSNTVSQVNTAMIVSKGMGGASQTQNSVTGMNQPSLNSTIEVGQMSQQQLQTQQNFSLLQTPGDKGTNHQ